MSAIRGRNPEAYRAGFRVGDMMRTDPEGLEQFLELGAKALGDVMSEIAPHPLRWRAGEFLLGMCRGYSGGKNMADEATERVI